MYIHIHLVINILLVILEEIPVIEIAKNKLIILKDVPNVDDSCKNYVAETKINVKISKIRL